MPLSDISFVALHQNGTLLDDFLADLASQRPAWRVGAALRLPRHRLGYCVEKLDSWQPNAAYGLADPETRLMLLPYRNRGRGRDDHAYVQESDPAANRSRFVTQTLRAQAAAGRDVLISPWLIYGTSGNKRELQVTLDLAARAQVHPLTEGRTLLAGFEATEAIFADKAQRDAMLDEITELEGAPIYLRMTTPATLTGRRQYDNEHAIAGLRAAIEALSENGHPVLLPQTGLAGWLMLPYGGLCFGAGIPGTLQRSPMPVASSGGGGGQPPLQWYFEPQLLGFVRADELGDLARVAGATTCDCPYCTARPPAPGAGFDPSSADKHFLWWCVRLADEVRQATDRAATVRRRVEAAEQHWRAVQRAGVVRDDRSQPTHLGAWTRVVA